MANFTSAINVQIDTETKQEATKILNDLGLSMSTAINLFLRQVIKNDGLPFEVVNPKPSRRLKKALKEAEDIMSGKIQVPTYNNREELKKALLSND